MLATHAQIGIWFMLLCFCHRQMNNGMIKGCQQWPDEVWQRIAGAKSVDIAQECPLWHFSGMVLVVHHYDSKSEETYKRKQRLGKMYAEKRWSALHEKKIVNIRVKNGSPIESPNGSPHA